MGVTRVEIEISASVDDVFETVSRIENFEQAIPQITKVEFLSEMRYGVGTRFRETRNMNGREATVELEVTEFVENERVRIVADSHGCVWDSVFITEAIDDGTRLTLEMEGRAYRWTARIMNVLIGGMLRKALQKDMEAVKRYCEAAA